MILFLYGADTYRSKRKLDDIRAKFLREIDPSGLNHGEIDGAKAEIGEMRAAISAAPFLAKKRLVILKDAVATCKKKEAEALAEALGAVPADTILVIHERAGAEDLEGSSAYNRLKGGEFYPEFKPMTPRQMQAWIDKEAKSRAVTFTKEASAAYQATAGNDCWKIVGELDAMSAAAGSMGKSVIDADLVREFTHAESEESIFDFLDAVGTRRLEVAAKLLDGLLAQDETEVSLLSRLQSHARGLLVASELSAQGDASKDRLSRELGIHPFAAAKILSQSRYFKPAEIERLYVWLIDADEKLKRGGWPKPRMALDRFLAELAAPREA
jgi:DNA polymerase III delta subunit